MPTVTLLTRVHKDHQLEVIDNVLKQTLEGLRVEAKICQVTSHGWVQITISGEDEKIAQNYLSTEIGFCPTSLNSISKFSTMKGHIATIDSSKNNVLVDIGVFSPSVTNVSIPLHYLQAQLADGRRISLEKLADLYGFCANLPLTTKILHVDKEKGYIEAMLAERQISQYKNWTRSLLDRLVILGVTHSAIEQAVKMTKCNRDIVDIERLGLFEHAVACKLGTDAAGLIPKIGRILRHATLSIYNPRKIRAFLGNDYAGLPP